MNPMLVEADTPLTWHYHCPKCGQDLEVKWRWHALEVTCPKCNHTHYPPTPNEDHYAYFSGDDWPEELQNTVISLRGTTCAVPGCYQDYVTLGRKVPVSKGGRISVDNLLPLCEHHAQTRGDKDYNDWLQDLREHETKPDDKTFEITFTSKTRAAEAVAPPAGFAQVLAAGAELAGKPPTGMKLVAAVPFLPGSSQRLVLSFDWQAQAEGKAKVLLLAWQHKQRPNLATIDRVFMGLRSEVGIDAKSQQRGSQDLELRLPQPAEDRWICAILIEDKGTKLGLDNYLLTLAS